MLRQLQKSVQNIIIIRDYLQRNIPLELRKKWKNLLLELVCLFLILFHILFSKKIKLLLLNALDNEENYLNVTYLIEYFKKRTWYIVYQPPAVILVYFLSNNKTPVLEFLREP